MGIRCRVTFECFGGCKVVWLRWAGEDREMMEVVDNDYDVFFLPRI